MKKRLKGSSREVLFGKIKTNRLTMEIMKKFFVEEKTLYAFLNRGRREGRGRGGGGRARRRGGVYVCSFLGTIEYKRTGDFIECGIQH